MDDSSRPAADEATFEPARLLANCLNKISLATMVLDQFETQAHGDLAKLATLAEAGNLLDISRVAHGLKGAAAVITAARIEVAAARVEEAARTSTLEETLAALAELRVETDRCLAGLPAARAVLQATPIGNGIRA